MSVESVLLPVFVQVLLTFVLMMHMGRRRLGALGRGEARMDEVALGEPRWPAACIQAANSFNNQFQLPVLWMLLVGFALATRKADLLFVVTSWIFVVLRIAHAAVHVTSNNVRPRFYVYLAGAILLFAMWILFAARLFAGV
jgi:hypothetical protein